MKRSLKWGLALLLLLPLIAATTAGMTTSDIFKLAEKNSKPNGKQSAKKIQQAAEKVAFDVNVPVDWIVGIIHHESEFRPDVSNFLNKKYHGILQCGDLCAEDLGLDTDDITDMNTVEQLENIVGPLLLLVKKRYRPVIGFQSMPELYLAVLYPKALNNYDLLKEHFKGNKKYRQNKGLDTDKNGEITFPDLDNRFKTKYPSQYWSMRWPETPDFKRGYEEVAEDIAFTFSTSVYTDREGRRWNQTTAYRAGMMKRLIEIGRSIPEQPTMSDYYRLLKEMKKFE